MNIFDFLIVFCSGSAVTYFWMAAVWKYKTRNRKEPVAFHGKEPQMFCAGGIVTGLLASGVWMAKHFFLPLFFVFALSSSTHAQYGPLPVIEVGPNLLANQVTMQESILQVLNSNQEVEMMRRNLVPGQSGGGDDLIEFLKRLDEVLGEGSALHYQLGGLREEMAERYPGYVDPGRMYPVREGTADASLHTLRGVLLTVREQLKLSEQIKEYATLAGLEGASSSARGNLQVQQAGNAINIEIIKELRKIRQLLGASINAQNVAITHQINQRSGEERGFDDWMMRSQISTTAYSGGSGFGPGDLLGQ